MRLSSGFKTERAYGQCETGYARLRDEAHREKRGGRFLPTGWTPTPSLGGVIIVPVSGESARRVGSDAAGVLGRRCNETITDTTTMHDLDADDDQDEQHADHTSIPADLSKHVFCSNAGVELYRGGARAPPNGRVAAVSRIVSAPSASRWRGGGASPPSPASLHGAVSEWSSTTDLTAVCCEGASGGIAHA